MMKARLLEQIREELRARLLRLSKAAAEAHAAATDAGSKAESKYDTRNLEASYLATGQARMVEELAESLRLFETFELRAYAPNDAIAMGALVKTKVSGHEAWFLLAPCAGGLEINCSGSEVTILSPASPLFQQLDGKHIGERVDQPNLLIVGLA
jgi:transcription elongation GreA/GreB family factor